MTNLQEIATALTCSIIKSGALLSNSPETDLALKASNLWADVYDSIKEVYAIRNDLP